MGGGNAGCELRNLRTAASRPPPNTADAGVIDEITVSLHEDHGLGVGHCTARNLDVCWPLTYVPDRVRTVLLHLIINDQIAISLIREKTWK